MKKRGFTLVELLAVIVVLAVIALIATPIVNNSIEKSKKGTAIESANNLISSAEYYILKTSDKYGKVSVLDENLKYSGKKPEFGEIEINKQGRASLYAYINGYCVNKDYDGEAYATKMKKEDCSWYTTDNYEPQEGTVITVDNISASTSGNSSTNIKKIRNYLIYGNTTQAIRSGKNILNMANFTTSYTNGYYEDKATNFKLTAGKTYTLSFNYKVNSAGATLSTGVGYGTDHYSADFIHSKAYPNQTSGRQSVTFTTPSDLADGNYLFVRFARTGSTASASVAISSIQLEEGSSATKYEPYGAMPSPEFPSEIKNTGDLITKENCASYGSDACNNAGKYVVQVKASGKNIFDVNSWYNWLRTFTTQYVAKETIDGIEVIRYQPPVTYNKPWMQGQFKENTKYTFSYKAKGIVGTNKSTGFKFVYTDGTTTTCYVDNEATWKNYTCASSGKTIDHLEMNYFYGQGCYFDINSIQLEEDSTATTYEAYKGKMTNIYLDEPLRKVGDYVDYIDYANGKVVRNIRKLVFNGTEGWWKNGDYGDYVSFYVTTSIGDFKPINGLGYSNMATVASWNNIQKTNGNYWWHFLPTSYGMRINKNYLDNYDSATTDGARVTLFKNWLKSHNVEVIQVLKTPKEESVKLPEIQTVEGINYITVNTTTSASNLKITTNK